MKYVLSALISTAAMLPSTASARPCSDSVPVVVNGTHWIVYTAGANEYKVNCRKARMIAKRALRGDRNPFGWRCRHIPRVMQRCVRGTKVRNEEYGFKEWEYLIGWHLAD